MNLKEARKILGINNSDTNVHECFRKRKTLITGRLNSASSESLQTKYREMLRQLELAVAVVINPRSPVSSQRKNQPSRSSNSISETGTSQVDIEQLVGQTLAGRYHIIEKLGSGRTGLTYSAVDLKRKQNVAIKIFYPDLLVDTELRTRFIKTINLASELYHPNIVNLFDINKDGRYYFITMNLLKGQSLSQLLKSRKKRRIAFSKQEVSKIISMLVKGLAYANNKLTHRNLEPETVWVDEKGIVKIMDFGMAPLIESDHRLQSDPHALGAMIYEMLTFKALPAGKIGKRVRHRKINKQFTQIINFLMNSKADRQFESYDQILFALSDIDRNQTASRFGRRTLTLALVAIVACASILFVIRSGLLNQLYSVIPISAEVEQLRFDKAIQLVKAINEITRQLRQKQKQLDFEIRQDRRQLSALESDLNKYTSNSRKLEIQQQSQDIRDRLTFNLRLQQLSDTIIYGNSQYASTSDQVRSALSRVENKDHLTAISLLRPLLAGLQFSLTQFDNIAKYLAAEKELKQAQNTWQDFNRAQRLLEPVDIDQRIQSIAKAGQLAEQGKLESAIDHLVRLRKTYQNDHESDRRLVMERNRQITQHDRTLKIKNEWKSYLKTHRLSMTAEQSKTIEQSKVLEQKQITAQDFKVAEITSRNLEQQISAFFAASRASVAALIKKRAEDRARQARANEEKTLAVAKSATLPTNPKNRSADESVQVTNLSPAELLKKYAPGLNLIEIPPGRFQMGHYGPGGNNEEKPHRQVTIAGFKLMKHEITFQQYDIYASDTGRDKPDDEGWGRDNHPVINLSWEDATAYARWLSRKTKYRFRLPSEAEWEYAARAHTNTAFSWGDAISHDNANYGSYRCCAGSVSGADKWFNSAPVGSFQSNQYGLFDMHGNVWEWVQDCWNDSYNAAPQDGSAWLTGDCNRRVLRGGAWNSVAENLRAGKRESAPATQGSNSSGFRLVMDP